MGEWATDFSHKLVYPPLVDVSHNKTSVCVQQLNLFVVSSLRFVKSTLQWGLKPNHSSWPAVVEGEQLFANVNRWLLGSSHTSSWMRRDVCKCGESVTIRRCPFLRPTTPTAQRKSRITESSGKSRWDLSISGGSSSFKEREFSRPDKAKHLVGLNGHSTKIVPQNFEKGTRVKKLSHLKIPSLKKMCKGSTLEKEERNRNSSRTDGGMLRCHLLLAPPHRIPLDNGSSLPPFSTLALGHRPLAVHYP